MGAMQGFLRGCVSGVALALWLAGCGAGESTRLRGSDFDVTIPHMVDSLARSEFLARRNADSQRAAIVINKVTNLTTDVIPVAEQWMLMARIRGALPLLELLRNKNIVFQVTPERWEQIRQEGFQGDLGPREAPTHVMSATFHSARRTLRDKGPGGHVKEVSDYYYLEFSITNLTSREVEWSDKFEFRRSASGLRID